MIDGLRPLLLVQAGGAFLDDERGEDRIAGLTQRAGGEDLVDRRRRGGDDTVGANNAASRPAATVLRNALTSITVVLEAQLPGGSLRSGIGALPPNMSVSL